MHRNKWKGTAGALRRNEHLGASELLRKRVQRGRSKCDFVERLKLFGVLNGLEGLPNTLWISAVPDFQDAQHCRPERTQFPLREAPLFAFQSSFLSSSLYELVGECHGFGLKGFSSDLLNALLEQAHSG